MMIPNNIEFEDNLKSVAPEGASAMLSTLGAVALVVTSLTF